MTDYTPPPFVIFSYLTEEKGHLILDDIFWFKSLISVDKRTKIYTSKKSVKNLTEQFSEYSSSFHTLNYIRFFKKINSRLHLFSKIYLSPSINNSTIIIQGFEELSLIFFLLKIRKRQNKVILILTNNVSPERLKRSRWLLQFLLRYIFKKCDVVFYHTDFEFKLIKEIVNHSPLLPKIKKLKYHLIGLKHSNLKKGSTSKIISFFGPTLPSKPIDDICKLILSDSKNQFYYRFINVGLVSKQVILKNIGTKTNVSFINEYLEHKEYLNLIKSSKFIFLPHNFLFEGKLSGILSDCISIGTPVISNNIEPVLEFFRDYGAMGYVFNFLKDKNWPKKFLRSQSINEYKKFTISLKNCKNSHNNTLIINEFLRSIGFKNKV